MEKCFCVFFFVVFHFKHKWPFGRLTSVTCYDLCSGTIQWVELGAWCPSKMDLLPIQWAAAQCICDIAETYLLGLLSLLRMAAVSVPQYRQSQPWLLLQICGESCLSSNLSEINLNVVRNSRNFSRNLSGKKLSSATHSKQLLLPLQKALWFQGHCLLVWLGCLWRFLASLACCCWD